jgi:hypothetical protein
LRGREFEQGLRESAAMSVRRTVARCPVDTEAQEGCGIPWGATVAPFAATDELRRPPELGDHGEALPRCDSCYAYLNSFCDIDKWAWTCALCGQLMAFTEEQAARYQMSASPNPEVLSSFIDLEFEDGEFRSCNVDVLVWRVDLNQSNCDRDCSFFSLEASACPISWDRKPSVFELSVKLYTFRD